jgi:alkyl sulfatase BDS1-like metallo-beta-lactamase superfamily hydrolase
VRTASQDVVSSVPTGMFLDFMAVRFNPEGLDDVEVKINLDFTDTKEKFVLSLDNSVLNNIPNKQVENPDASLTLTRAIFNQVAVGQTSFAKEIVKGNVKVGGSPLALMKVFANLDEFNPDFNIVTP